MTRALIAIGINHYDFINDLAGAENDATNVFDALSQDGAAPYTTRLSKLVHSPTLNELRAVIEDLVLAEPLDELTFFFAGHGLINSVGFYMALKDTDLLKPTATAYSLSELFAHISQCAPKQTNIILDACFSGGLAADLSVLVRPETSGYIGSPAVTLLAMSARDQTAAEFSDGGVGTRALLDCISGRALVREDVQTLSLLDICPIVVDRVDRSGLQNPVYTALNVHSRSAFCNNPLYYSSARGVLAKWSAQSFLDTVRPVLASHASSPDDVVADVERLFDKLIILAETDRDLFRGAEIRAASAVALLPFAHNSEIRQVLRQRLSDLAEHIDDRIAKSVEALLTERHVLLAGSEGLANLFLLPIRLSKLLGWTSCSFHLHKILEEGTFPKGDFEELIGLLLDTYGVSLQAISDSQASYLAVALTAMSELKLDEQGELILSSVFNSYVECRANVASSHLEPRNILNYLLSRNLGKFDPRYALVAKPSELGAVLLLSSKLFGLSEVFDFALADLDHTSVNAFVPDSYLDYFNVTVESGENSTFMIGHDIWSVDDLVTHWPQTAFDTHAEPVVCCGAILSALLYPDRVPWFLFPRELSGTTQGTSTAVVRSAEANRSPTEVIK